MKKHIISFLFAVLSTAAYSQIVFESGYFIDNEGKQTECLIKNLDWKYNPTEFQYKLEEDSEVMVQNIAAVQEFEIRGIVKYLRATVNMDRASDHHMRLSTTKEPEFKEEQLFLKVLIEGTASLFYYEEINLVRYFFQTGDEGIEQLVYKKYSIDEFKIGENTQFKKQLRDKLPCGINSIVDLHELEYKTRALSAYFVNYHNCLDLSYSQYKKRQGKVILHVNLRPRLNFSSLRIKKSNFNPVQLGFDSKMMLSFGLEFELVLPVNKNKWALIAEPSISHYSSSDEWTYIETAVEARTTDVFVNYSAFEVPIGLRHYLFFDENSKAFVNASVVITKSFSSSVSAERRDLLDLPISTDTNLAFGVGYKYKDILSMEFRIHSHKVLLSTYLSWSSAYVSSSIILGFTVN